MPKNPQKDRNIAATQFQAIWRGYCDRKSLPQKPLTSSAISNPIMIVGNEPKPVFEHPKEKGHFVYVGTGGLANFSWIAEIAASLKPDEKGRLHIPKVFIIDMAHEVKEFWEMLKKVCANAHDYDTFVLESNDLFKFKETARRRVSFDWNDELRSGILGLGMPDKKPKFGYHDRYTFFREVIAKLTVIHDNYANPRVWEYLENVTDPKVPRYVYASNIVEYLPRIGHYGSHAEKINRSILQYIVKFKPKWTIHARTTLEHASLFSKTKFEPIPDIFMILKTELSADEQYSLLNVDEYVPLNKIGYETAKARRDALENDDGQTSISDAVDYKRNYSPT